ncbi:hypothetical protein PLICRDRAFT_138047 [Plicaturopsis crispa FD-325 SS-3]|nr:hypothetical protein PLICRDRAFT_138047 [Plicaturopsis crispa FD-325 SS-3]
MQLTSNFSALLATVLVALSASEGVDARLTRRASPPSTSSVTVPVENIQSLANSDLHPHVVHQQHVNRANKRLALMTGREIPSDLELASDLHRRIGTLEPAMRKRYNHDGIADILAAFGAPSSAKPSSAATSVKGATNDFETTDGSNGGYSDADEKASESNALTKANPATFKNSLGLDIEANDVGYVATIKMGNPPKDFRVLVDSGSSDLWVGGENCQGDDGGDCGKHAFLGSKGSSSFKDTGKSWTINYGSGSVQGSIVQDDISIGDLQLKAHTFGTARNESSQFTPDQIPFDGLMGLAQSKLSKQQTYTVVEALQKSGQIQEAITSFRLSRLSDGKKNGEITFGALDDSAYDASSLVTVKNVNNDGFWEAAVGGVKVDDKDFGWSNKTAILDTGTSLLMAPNADAEALHQAIPGAKFIGDQWMLPCTTNATLSLAFGGKQFAIDPRDLAFLPSDPKNLTGMCVSGISVGNSGGDNQWLVGDVFLKNVYFSTNVGKNEISLAKLSG